jgi:uncharacterized protein (TIGR00730 family)
MRLGVFCGSGLGNAAAFCEQVGALGHLLADEGIGLVYGGARVGLMGVLADAVLAHGGDVTGVIPRALVQREIAHSNLTELRVVESMHERKAVMAELAEGFVALPGGTGTMEELFEAWTWGQLGIHVKPCGLLNIAGYYDGLLAFIDRAMTTGFLSSRHREMLVVESDARALLHRFSCYSPPENKWTGSTAPTPPNVRREGAPPVIDALAWVCVQSGRVLGVRSRHKEVFYIPGGKRNSGESDFGALAREIKEELSVRLLPETLTLVTVVNAPAHGYSAGTTVRMTCYCADHIGDLRPDSEIEEVAWLSWADRVLCAPAAQRVLDAVHVRGWIH